MLSRLSISNYALIDHLDFNPGDGLSIITGETGAGKSVMLGALGLLMGERADMKVIAEKQKKAVVEGCFINVGEDIEEMVKTLDPEWPGDELFIRREIYPSGRSRAFLNDSPVSLASLQELGAGLLDIHSQNSNTMLSRRQTQLALIDAVAGNALLMKEYGEQYREYVAIRQKMRRNKEEAEQLRQQQEMIAFRLGQLDKLKPKAGELAKIETRHDTLSNSEEIRSSLVKARNVLYEGEPSAAIDQIEEAASALVDVDFSLWEEEDPEIQERLRRCVVELKDIVESVESAIGMTEYNPATLASLSSRMNEYYSALRNFRVDSDEELETLHKELRAQMDSIENGGFNNDDLERESRQLARSLKQLGGRLSEMRGKAAASLQEEVEAEARKLGLENLRFKIELKETKLSKSGGDSVEFQAAFNKNSRLMPVGEMASGGEMARLMLAIKKITASRLQLPTIIFDEIDTGVSGSIADRMGEMMREMGTMMQILTITHLPQVAVKGKRHFKVFKEDRGDMTVSDVMLLTPAQREEEIGRMLSGRKLDQAALSNARSLLGENTDK